jgi:molybdate transport system ATP-binding protein
LHQYPDGFQLDAAFEADDGVTALFGPSGSGKSTILALIAGILRARRGRIVLSGRVLVDTAGAIWLPPERRRIGVVFQDHLLFPHLNVRHNLNFGRNRSGRSIDFQRVVEVLEMGDLLDRHPATLSGGQQQRVSLGRALLAGPELLLMDEPLTGLDANLKDRVLTYLQRAVVEWGIPTLFVSHDQTDVRRFASSVVILQAGRVVASGPTDTVWDQAMRSGTVPATVPVNLVHVEDVCEVENHWQGTVSGQVLHLPGKPADHAGKSVWVQFGARDLMLAHGTIRGLSARNQLRGKVRALVGMTGMTLVSVDVGQPLWAEVTAEAVRELGLAVGQEVICILKATALRIVG